LHAGGQGFESLKVHHIELVASFGASPLAFAASFFAAAIFRANEVGAPPEFVFILSK